MGEVDIVTGVTRITNHESIAIVVLFTIVLLQWGVIGKLLASLLKVREALEAVRLTINTLNERLNRHD